MNNKKGITMITLVVTVVLMMIIAGTVATESLNGIKTRKINDLYNDLRLISDKVSIYYIKFGTLPVGEKYEGSNEFESVKNINDSSNYYIINLNALENITLNYTEGNKVFIINEETHTIYYPEGLEVDGVMYYTLPETYTLIK